MLLLDDDDDFGDFKSITDQRDESKLTKKRQSRKQSNFATVKRKIVNNFSF